MEMAYAIIYIIEVQRKGVGINYFIRADTANT